MEQSKREKKTESEIIEEVVNRHFRLNLRRNTRQRPYVNARATMSYLLRQKGYSLQAIGRILNKNHATIINLTKNFEWYLKSDPEFRHIYQNIAYEIAENDDAIYEKEEKEIIKEIFSLRNQNKLLNSQIERLTLEQEKTKSNKVKYQKIFEMIEERTRDGYEDEVLKKLNAIYNGLYSK